jgi:hypothetical protein
MSKIDCKIFSEVEPDNEEEHDDNQQNDEYFYISEEEYDEPNFESLSDESE